MIDAPKTAPRLSIVVIFHDMERESKRTLFALSEQFQTEAPSDQYEVIAVENGSQTLDPAWVVSHGPNFRYHFHDTTSPSPAEAVNKGAEMARGAYVALIVDGARIPSPGLVKTTLQAVDVHASCFVSALAWHLGPDVQRKSRLAGYNQAAEDEMLEVIDWKSDGYRLFDVATLAPSSGCGFLNGLPKECSWLALPKTCFDELGGYDTGFQSPGGGLVNHDFLRRLCLRSDMTPVQLVGEGTFHQIHSGAATGQADLKATLQVFGEEYQRLRGVKFRPFDLPAPHYVGQLLPSAQRFVLDDVS